MLSHCHPLLSIWILLHVRLLNLDFGVVIVMLGLVDFLRLLLNHLTSLLFGQGFGLLLSKQFLRYFGLFFSFLLRLLLGLLGLLLSFFLFLFGIDFSLFLLLALLFSLLDRILLSLLLAVSLTHVLNCFRHSHGIDLVLFSLLLGFLLCLDCGQFGSNSLCFLASLLLLLVESLHLLLVLQGNSLSLRLLSSDGFLLCNQLFLLLLNDSLVFGFLGGLSCFLLGYLSLFLLLLHQ